MALTRAELHGRWVHSHEEDADDERVYRPADYPFPPSRGRDSFELRPDGTATEWTPGATDRSVAKEGRWTLERGGRVALRGPHEAKAHRVLEVVSLAPDRLVVKR